MATIVYSSSLSASDPSDRPVTIIGKKDNLCKLQFSDVSSFFGTKVTAETWTAGLKTLTEDGGSCSLWLNSASVAALPTQFSRHNTSSQSHTLTKLVQSEGKKGPETLIIIVCERAEVLASGCAVARAYPTYSSKTTSHPLPSQNVTVGFLVVGEKASSITDDDVKCLSAECEGIRLAAEIVDAPTNEMHTDIFIEKIREVATKLGLEPPLVIQGEDLREQGFGGIYGVGKAAEHKPALVVLSHTPPGAKETISWCGKGIVYDTGGLSIKTNMPGMKRDCGGAAAILGAFYVAVKLGFSQKLHAVFCLAENSVGPLATRPDDIHTFYSGKTVEINNTDAEGRLVLGDGVAYARKVLKSEWVVDLATLTGAQGIATGKYHGAVLSNCEDSQKAIFDAGRTCGDLTFPLPYCPELHFREFDSVVADMKNHVMNRGNAESSCGGLFIGAHLGFDFEGVWIHVDMAAPVYTGERATGYGVALLTTLYGARSTNPLLRSSAPFFHREEKYLKIKAAKVAAGK